MREEEPPKKVLKDQGSRPQEILIPGSEEILKHTTKTFHGGKIAEHIQEWQTLISGKFIMQMVRGDTVELGNGIPIKHNAKNPSFSPE